MGAQETPHEIFIDALKFEVLATHPTGEVSNTSQIVIASERGITATSQIIDVVLER